MDARFAWVAIGLALAGCVDVTEESAERTCPSLFVSVHYERAADESALRPAFEDAGYGWVARTSGVADVTSPAGVAIVLSLDTGPSGDALVLSVEDPQAGAARVRETAKAASEIVNETSEDAQVSRWIEASRTVTC